MDADDLVALVRRVFAPRESDTGIAILVDEPDEVVTDTPAWHARREMAAQWASLLREREAQLGLPTALFAYRNAHTNNGDLPADGARRLDHGGERLMWDELFTRYSILMAPTQFSATAPLKVVARRYPIRAATMPGFRAEMLPALRIDYTEVSRRVNFLAELLSSAEGAEIELSWADRQSELFLDLRFRSAHASGGLLHTPGTAGNLPSGEAYIVPYEGERPGEPSRTAGLLPVQFGDEVVVYEVNGNRAARVQHGGPAAEREAARLLQEPAYGNIAELGLGVLAAFGVQPVGEVLLDEKLGLHIAFGRSEHFGGQVGPSAFSSPDAVVHIDRVYVPACQPAIRVRRVDLVMSDGQAKRLLTDDSYVDGLFD
ncbi:MAG: hypothetical protein AB7L71_09630 [Vicinamibacterales bacterium]